MSNIVKENVPDPYHWPASSELRKNLGPLKVMSEEVNQILALVQHRDGNLSSMDIDDKVHQAETKNADLEMEEKQQK